ncbi:Ger(x)C family spore germination protein [Gracilibacillus caseinilyticus]|uniref:Ger(X)C family spore germination protein n=1 Tax=Gracilibacillus caseinilyticus TaxID=2932256 RepID=A0ABY4F163_9BACI|nr:Ger(x)C family spore germination protein [Gracilibacillus caseinilyticus]UOQ50423.1 Ger(x)C family spore germination protein [Gracilibacillus caseinilyticus]
MIAFTKKFICLLLLSVLLTGCWSAKELTEITISTALAIDITDEGYELSIQAINPGEIAGENTSTRTTVSTYTATGKTMFEAIRKLTTVAPRKVNLSHLQVIIYGEETARQGIGKTLDFLMRDHELRTDFSIVIAQGLKGKDLISILTPLEKIPANKIKASLDSSQNFWAPTKEVELNELVNSISVPGKDAVLTGVYVVGNIQAGKNIENAENVDSPTRIYLDGLGIFHADKLQGWLSETESKGFNYITDNVTNTIGFVPCGDSGTISFEVVRSKTDLKADWKNGKPVINLTIDIIANIGDVECSIDFTDPKTIPKLQKQLESKTNTIVEESINAAKSYKSDIFGFGNALRHSKPKKWMEIRNDWEDHFTETEVKTKITVEIKKAGTITKPISEDIEKKTAKEE